MTSSDPSKDPPKEPPAATAGAGAAGDPSMEDILASIRRILSEDEPAAQVQTAEHGEADDDVLMLEASMMVPEPNPIPLLAPDIHGEPEAVSRNPATAPATAPASVTGVQLSGVQLSGVQIVPVAAETSSAGPDPKLAHGQAKEFLVAPEAAAAAAFSVGSLVRSIAAERSMQVHTGGPTIEDIVRAELRPLLKQWLDEHLPPMVERLVRAELERVIGHSGS